ncbi:Cysteine-rich receptor-like protein kinase 25 [Bienertia sinuspersici]
MAGLAGEPVVGLGKLNPNCTQQEFYKISEAEKFSQKLSILFDGLRKDAFRRFTLQICDRIRKRYRFSTDCSDCLQVGITQLESCCNTISGAGVYGPSCGVQFENNQFANTVSRSPPPSSSSSPLANPTSNQVKRWDAHKTWIAAVLFVLLLLRVSLILRFTIRRKRKLRNEAENKVQITCVDSLQFDFSTIQVATDKFSDAKRLVKDRRTTVYKGRLPNDQEIAVKRVSKYERHNNEILLLADLQHRNLVKLLGFCLEKGSRYLIYEYLPNESLDLFFCDYFKRVNLSWETRHKIILGIARGLLYLHEDSHLRVIHRDVKPSNILLDVAMNPKISNFSKASLVQADQTRGDRSTILEYAEQGQFSVKSDVFSFGVLLLEIISGQLISSFIDGEKGENLPTFVWNKWVEGKALEMHQDALLCVQEIPTSRPAMCSILVMLNSHLVPIDEPSRPAFVILSDRDVSKSYSSSQQDKSFQTSVNGFSITEFEPR